MPGFLRKSPSSGWLWPSPSPGDDKSFKQSLRFHSVSRALGYSTPVVWSSKPHYRATPRQRSKPPTQDRRRLTRYMRRWLVERFFARIQWQRRILVRWEYYTQNFLGFVQLACSLFSSGDFEIGSRTRLKIV